MMNSFVPPLRMVLTSKCNGKCAFCHHEGYTGEKEMSVDLATQIADVAQKIGIPSISITGGEPTLHPQVSEIISAIQQRSAASISLTTNGYNLIEVAPKLKDRIQKLNVSITSFDNALNSRYQDVDVERIKTAILCFPSEQKYFNILLTPENCGHLDEIILFCRNNNINLDLMFETQKNLKCNVDVERFIIAKLADYGDPVILLGNPSVVSFSCDEIAIRIKHPQISALVKRQICKTCNEQYNCLEKVCAVRVFPDASVSPCLSLHHHFKDASIEKNIVAAYRLFDTDELLLQTIFE